MLDLPVLSVFMKGQSVTKLIGFFFFLALTVMRKYSDQQFEITGSDVSSSEEDNLASGKFELWRRASSWIFTPAFIFRRAVFGKSTKVQKAFNTLKLCFCNCCRRTFSPARTIVRGQLWKERQTWIQPKQQRVIGPIMILIGSLSRFTTRENARDPLSARFQ